MLTDRYATRVRGVLSCFDRILITGMLPDICHAQAFTRELNAIRTVARDEVFLYPSATRLLLGRYQASQHPTARQRARWTPSASASARSSR